MIWVAIIVLAPIALVGHAALWISFWNHVQGTAMPLWMNAGLSHIAKACIVLMPAGFAFVQTSPTASTATIGVYNGYWLMCVLIGLIGVPVAFVRRQRRQFVTNLRRTESKVHQFDDSRRESWRLARLSSKLAFAVPGNQACEVEENEKEIEIPRLARELDGLSIAHISDLHYTGRIAKSFFDQAIDLVNDMDADIVAVTGDLVDRKQYLSWIPVTLGRLRARHGVYVVLGNHDCKQNLSNLRLMLSEVGLIGMGGRLEQLKIRDQNVILAGNELPWIVPATDMTECPSRDEMDQLRVLLAHSPDQLAWAQFYDFDLMMAGHTHGGQFCLPWFGPVACPSRLPLEFASGTIYEDPTVLHVSRGLSGEIPLRLNCRPEITKLTLRCPQETKTIKREQTSRLLTV